MRLFVQGAVLLLGMGFLSAPAKAQKVVIEDDSAKFDSPCQPRQGR